MDDDPEIIQYPNLSVWIVSVAKGKEENGRCFVSVVADTKNTWINGGYLEPTTAIFGIVKIEEWDRLVEGRYAYTKHKANSTGTVFYHRWLNDSITFYNDYQSDTEAGALADLEEQEHIDGKTLGSLIDISNLTKENNNKLASAKFKELIDKGKYDPSVLQDWLKKTSDVEDLYKKTKVIENALGAGEFENKTLIVQLIREIEGTFSISISKRLAYGLLNAVGLGRLNPAKYVSYRYKLKNLYDTLDRDGLKGMSKVGKRMLQAHNPLLKNRSLYRLSKTGQAVKQMRSQKHKVIKKGTTDYDKAILKYHQQSLKQEKEGIIKQNSLKLVKTSEGDLRWVGSKKAKQITELGIKKAEEMEAIEDALDIASFIPVVRPFAKAFQFVLNVSLFKSFKNKKKDD